MPRLGELYYLGADGQRWKQVLSSGVLRLAIRVMAFPVLRRGLLFLRHRNLRIGNCELRGRGELGVARQTSPLLARDTSGRCRCRIGRMTCASSFSHETNGGHSKAPWQDCEDLGQTLRWRPIETEGAPLKSQCPGNSTLPYGRGAEGWARGLESLPLSLASSCAKM